MNKPQLQNYEICLKEHLDDSWADWFTGLSIQQNFSKDGNPITILKGPIMDQSALHGIFARIQALGLTIVFVRSRD